MMGENPMLWPAIPGIQGTQRVEPAEKLFIAVLRELFRDDTGQRDDGNSLGADCRQRAQRVLDGKCALAMADKARDARNGLEDGVHIVGCRASVTKHRRAGR